MIVKSIGVDLLIVLPDPYRWLVRVVPRVVIIVTHRRHFMIASFVRHPFFLRCHWIKDEVIVLLVLAMRQVTLELLHVFICHVDVTLFQDHRLTVLVHDHVLWPLLRADQALPLELFNVGLHLIFVLSGLPFPAVVTAFGVQI